MSQNDQKTLKNGLNLEVFLSYISCDFYVFCSQTLSFSSFPIVGERFRRSKSQEKYIFQQKFEIGNFSILVPTSPARGSYLPGVFFRTVFGKIFFALIDSENVFRKNALVTRSSKTHEACSNCSDMQFEKVFFVKKERGIFRRPLLMRGTMILMERFGPFLGHKRLAL